MLIQEIFSILSTGPLSNLSISGEGSGDIVESGRQKVINHLNAGLLKLHSRFLLQERELLLTMIPGRTNYQLHSRHGRQYKLDNPDSTYAVFIEDTPLAPFQDDVIKVLSVFNTLGDQVALNDNGNPTSVFTPNPQLLQVPSSGSWAGLSLLYQARAPKLTVESIDDGVNVDIPQALEAALINYVASEVFSNMTGAENSAKGQELMLKYEMECSQVIEGDLVNSSVSTTHNKFEAGGWR